MEGVKRAVTKPNAFIFDLDGTLLDTLEDIADSVNRVMRQQGFPEHSPAAVKTFIGDGAEVLIRRALPAVQRSESKIAECLEAYLDDYGANWDQKTRPYDGIPGLLNGLTRSGIRMAVLSNKPHLFTEKCVMRFLSEWQFVKVIGSGGRFPRKPDPAAARFIADCMQEAPDRIFYTGDSATDMKTALAAGMFPVGAGWGFRPESELVATGCRFLARRPMDIVGFLNSGASVEF